MAGGGLMESNGHFDAIVVGAGPAGSTAARGLALAGLRTLLLEKERLPRYKTCGGGVPGKVAEVLGFDVSSVAEQPISRALITCEAAPPLRYDFDRTVGWCVMRSRFDQHLAEKAIAAGAELRDRTAVQGIDAGAASVVVRTAHGACTASLVIGADGVNGRVARWAGLGAGRPRAVALEAEIEAPAAAMDAWQGVLHLHFGGVPWGYAWVFPKAQHLSIGVATFQDRHRVDLRRSLRDFLDSQPLLKQHTVLQLRGQHIPRGGRRGRLHAGRIMLAGDAGGFADPFLGEGIYYAIRSGQLAAQVAGNALDACGPPDLSSYTRLAAERLHVPFAPMAWFGSVFYRFPAAFCWLQQRSPTVQSFVRRCMDIDFSYGAAGQQLARRGGRILLELARTPAGK
jgi:geranylgeranyl reductase family protein